MQCQAVLSGGGPPVMAFLIGLPDPVEDALRAGFGGLAPVVSVVLVLWVNAKITEVRRAQEAKAAAAAGRAISEGAKAAVTGVPSEQWQKLVLCVIIDVLGDSSFALPGLGELSDIAYAPLEAYLLSRLFQSNVISTFGAIEEGLPFTDAIPTATIAWLMETFFADTPPGRWLGLTPPVRQPDPAADEAPKKG
eukprot:jgi/Tetstr1/442206/TSEL_030353.t1